MINALSCHMTDVGAAPRAVLCNLDGRTRRECQLDSALPSTDNTVFQFTHLTSSFTINIAVHRNVRAIVYLDFAT
jgi:hypothetical protein